MYARSTARDGRRVSQNAMEPTQGYVILNARKGLKDPVKNPMKTVTGSFATLRMTQGRTVQGGPGTGAGVTCSGDRHWTLSFRTG